MDAAAPAGRESPAEPMIAAQLVASVKPTVEAMAMPVEIAVETSSVSETAEPTIAEPAVEELLPAVEEVFTPVPPFIAPIAAEFAAFLAPFATPLACVVSVEVLREDEPGGPAPARVSDCACGDGADEQRAGWRQQSGAEGEP